ncbi:MAG TPA: DUF4386 domain-containing protein [Gemmatimonadaceae bacterium]|nr:DUF4386 domain-containing protein [Gemmatimonadaceae bacterium]
MVTAGIEIDQQNAARIAGWAGLLSLPFVLLPNFGVIERFIIRGDAVQSARNIVAHQLLFRLSIASELLYAAGLLMVIAGYYVILAPIGRNLALIAATWRLIYGLMWIAIPLGLFEALRLLHGTPYLQVIGNDQLQAMARLATAAGGDQYYLGLLFWSLSATASGWLWVKSRFIPRGLAWFGVIAAAWCVLCTIIYISVPDFAHVVNLWWFDTPLALFEIALSMWLIAKGLPGSREEYRPVRA